MKTCPHCRSKAGVPSRARSFSERVITRVLLMRHYRCRTCLTRFLGFIGYIGPRHHHRNSHSESPL